MPSRRNDRAADALRAIRFTRHYTRHAEGSVLVEFGDTRVLCTATVEDGVPGFLRGKGQGWITAEYGMLPRATHTRSAREAARGKQIRPHPGNPAPDRPIAARGGRSARPGRAHASRSIATCCRPTAARARPPITGGYVALADAMRRAACAPGPERTVRCTARWPRFRSASWAVSRCWISTTSEDSEAETDMNVVMNNGGALHRGAGHGRGSRLPAP